MERFLIKSMEKVLEKSLLNCPMHSMEISEEITDGIQRWFSWRTPWRGFGINPWQISQRKIWKSSAGIYNRIFFLNISCKIFWTFLRNALSILLTISPKKLLNETLEESMEGFPNDSLEQFPKEFSDEFVKESQE